MATEEKQSASSVCNDEDEQACYLSLEAEMKKLVNVLEKMGGWTALAKAAEKCVNSYEAL